jgi:hypothetical protein
LNIVDDVTRELTRLIKQRSKSSMIVSDSGKEFTSLAHACDELGVWVADYNVDRPKDPGGVLLPDPCLCWPLQQASPL